MNKELADYKQGMARHLEHIKEKVIEDKKRTDTLISDLMKKNEKLKAENRRLKSREWEYKSLLSKINLMMIKDADVFAKCLESYADANQHDHENE